MDLLPMHKLGARELPGRVLAFGVFLPWVSAQDGFRVWVKVIHEHDQFLQRVPPARFELQHQVDPDYGDYWSTQVDLTSTPPGMAGTRWGSDGRYVYRYTVQRPGVSEELDWVIDPFAREFGIGKLSAITVGYQQHVWGPVETQWKVPPVRDLVMYELMIQEFAGDVDATIKRMDYLADLGINCLEVMPVSNVSLTVDWGFLPIGYFGVDERLGHRKDLQRLVEAAHERGLAVILDVVYGHTSSSFAYSYVYRELGYHENPFMGPFAKDLFGESTDFRRKFTRDFFFTVNNHLLADCHVDGFRYDCVPNYWDGAIGSGYANLVFSTYRLLESKQGSNEHWQRFFAPDGSLNAIQCAEQLEGPVEILQSTYSNCTWQNETFESFRGTARGSVDDITALGFRSGLSGYPLEVTANGETIAKTALQYLENHDHERFMCNFGMTLADNDLLREGIRDHWYKLQPYLICLFTSCGIPMLWQGQEFGENYFLPDSGMGRVAVYRPVRWDYFYDEVGRSVVSLVRRLIAMRNRVPHLRGGSHFFFNDFGRYQSKKLLMYSRSSESGYSLVALNFGDQDQTVPFTFARGGLYREELHGQDLGQVAAGQEKWLTIPSNYGRVWTIV